MPTYEYTCANCKHDFERFESITAAPNKSCPKCTKKKAERRISGGGGFLFKGTGFYVTDYKKTSASDTSKAAADKGESKPAAAESKAGCATDCGCATPAAESKPPATESKKSESKSSAKKPTKVA